MAPTHVSTDCNGMIAVTVMPEAEESAAEGSEQTEEERGPDLKDCKEDRPRDNQLNQSR